MLTFKKFDMTPSPLPPKNAARRVLEGIQEIVLHAIRIVKRRIP